MRFNWKALIIAFIGLTLINSLFVFPLWYIGENYWYQFQVTPFLSSILLYVPALIANLVCLVFIFVLFDDGKKKRRGLRINSWRRSAAMATPSGLNRDGLINSFGFERHLTRTFLLIGTILACSVSFFGFLQSDDLFRTVEIGDYRNYSERIEYNNDWLKEIRSDNLELIASKLSSYIEDYQHTNNRELQLVIDGKWHSIFSNNLECFVYENELFKMSQSETMLVIGYDGKLTDDIKPLLNEDYEFWIDPNDIKHLKIRLSTKKCPNMIFVPVPPYKNCSYNASNRQFQLMSDDLFITLMHFDYLVYDSVTKQIRVEYIDPTENFFENNKIVFFTAWYLFSALIICLIILLLRKLSKSSFLNLSSKYRQQLAFRSIAAPKDE